MNKLLIGCLILAGSPTFAQNKQDTTRKLNEVVIKPYFSVQPRIRATGSVGLIDQAALEQQPSTSLVSTMNTIPGIRMEERSPGSYRLSIRGSLLRSPFGIRNVKIYFDEFPLTDAGGNTYLNALDVSAISGLQVLKGPQSGLYGANSGGVILIQPQGLSDNQNVAKLSLLGGSFGTFHEQAMVNQKSNNYTLNLTQAYQQSDGYRDHSAMDRKYLQAFQKWDYTKKASLKALLFFSDLHYNTPGGLTEIQYLQNPLSSRPATPDTKSAIEQNAGIYSKTIYGGISNDWKINDQIKQVTSIFSTYTDFKNPFITNYEKRKELTIGLRTYLAYTRQTEQLNWAFHVGLESMKTGTDFNNYDNNFGAPAALQASDRLNAASNFAFAHLNLDLPEKLLFELSLSANLYQYDYKSIAPVLVPRKTNRFDIQFMPRVALSYLISKEVSIRASVSKGYSPPTLAEVRASDNVINVDLQPEHGWNYETGLKYQAVQNRLWLDLTGFYYHLKDAIVRRLNDKNTQYFVNAGGTKQWGLETELNFQAVTPKTSGIVRSLLLRNSFTWSRFKFEDYIDKALNFSGNDLTGVPKIVSVSSADLTLPKNFYVFVQHNFTSRIPLNDANTAYATEYHLVQARIGKKDIYIGKRAFTIFMGADNLLNEKYSLGNDLNAVGGKYFNASASRNFYGGIQLNLNNK
jgi:iron complex outermembrane receptor protein